MKKKNANKIENRKKKQLKAHEKLMAARANGVEPLVEAVILGNQYVRQIVAGEHLAPGVERFELTDLEGCLVLTMDKIMEEMGVTRERARRDGLESVLRQAKIKAEFDELTRSILGTADRGAATR